MLLIWDDDRTLTVDERDSFDRSQFVVVKKVFVRFKDNAKDKDEKWIRSAFKQMFAIESVEIVREIDHTWAYITYAESGDTYRAIRDAPSLDEVEMVVSADTWVQPTTFSYIEPDSETVADALNRFESSSSVVVNQDSLRELISMSRKTNSASLKEALDRIVPSLTSFEFKLTNAKGTAISLSEVRSILQCIGQHISCLNITFHNEKYPAYVNRYYQKICQYAGPQMKALKLECFPANQDWLVGLKLLLGRIEILTLRIFNYDVHYDIDFELYCPNVKMLDLMMNLKGTLLSKKQPKLKGLSLLRNDAIDEKTLFEMMKNNPQLVYLKIQALNCNNLLKQISMLLPNLQRLCLHQGYPNIAPDSLELLTGMKQLKALELMEVDESDFNAILDFLPKFRQLEAIKLHLVYEGPDNIDVKYVFKPNFDSIVTLANELAQLKCFHLWYCQIDTETIKKFIRNAKSLEIFTLRGTGLQITDTVLDGIENIRRAEGLGTMTLYADQIHPELNREKTYSTVKLNSLEVYMSLPWDYGLN